MLGDRGLEYWGWCWGFSDNATSFLTAFLHNIGSGFLAAADCCLGICWIMRFGDGLAKCGKGLHMLNWTFC